MLVGCGGDNDGNSSSAGEGHVTFANAGWDSAYLHNAIAGTVAEVVFGYTWDELPGSTTVLLEGVATGEVDVQMETWTDNLATYEDDVENGRFQELGVNFDDNYQGIYVPRYVIEGDEERGIEAVAPDLQHVKDLNDYSEVFPDDEDPSMGRLYGSIPGWEVDDIIYAKYEHYNLDENFVYFRPGSDAALATAITSAYERGEPIAAYYWEPTWLLGMYDMVLLENEPFDPDTFRTGATEFPPVDVTVGASNNFEEIEENAELIAFLRNYETSSALTSEGLAYMQETDADYVETAKWFLSEHSELLDEWLEADDAQTIKDFLNK